jgi:hypothetical protein
MTLLLERGNVQSISIKAYHGSNSVFDKFDQGKARIVNDFYGGGVAYFSDSTKVAITYAQSMSRKSGKPVVYEVDLKLKKVFDVDHTYTGKELIKFVEKDDAESFARGAGLMTARDDKYTVMGKLKSGDYELTGEQVFRGLSRGMNQTAKARQILIDLGYDGLRYNGGVNMGMATKHSVYLAYDAKSITIKKKYGLAPAAKKAPAMAESFETLDNDTDKKSKKNPFMKKSEKDSDDEPKVAKDPDKVSSKEGEKHPESEDSKDNEPKPIKGSKTLTGRKQEIIDTKPMTETFTRTAVISFGRLNPPTSGHAKLVDKMKAVARKNNATPLLFLSHSSDKKKNPLTYDQKVSLAQEAFGDLVVKSPARTIIEILKSIEKKYDDVIIVVGSDRVREFDVLTNKYNSREYQFNSIKVESAGERDPDADDVTGMSASKLRSLAISGNFEAFKPGLPKKLQRRALEIYKLIRSQMGLHEMSNELDEDLAKELLELTISQRLRKRSTMRKIRSKLKVGRRRAMARRANLQTINKRARKQAISAIKTRFGGGKRVADMSAGEKNRVERIVKQRKAAVVRLAKRMIMKVRKTERDRFGGKSKNEEFESWLIANESVDTNDVYAFIEAADMVTEATHPIMKSSYHKQETLDRLKIVAVKKNDPDAGILEDTESKVYRVDVDGKHAGYIWKTSRDSNVMSGAIKIGTSTKRGWVCIRGKYIQGRRIEAEPYTPQSWADPVINILIDHIDKMNKKKNEDINEATKVVWTDPEHVKRITDAVEVTLKEWPYGSKPKIDDIVHYLLTQKTFGSRTSNYMMDNIDNVSPGLAMKISNAAKEAIISYSGNIFSKGSPKKNEPSAQVKRMSRYLSQKTIGPIKR